MKYRVTLAMPVYNVERYVEQALLSALNQTFGSIEYLIIDDKGQDDSMNIVRRIIAEHPRGIDVRIVDHIINQGTGATKNSAIKEAQGEYLYFMDSDDEITSNCIQVLYDKMIERPVDFVAASFVRSDVNGNILSNYIYLDSIFCDTNKKIVDYVYNNELSFYVTTWNKLYDITFLREKKIICFPKHFSEDILFSFQVTLAASSCRLISDILYRYNVIQGSATDTSSRTVEKSIVIAKQHLEILSFKKSKLSQYENRLWYGRLVNSIVFEAYFYAYWVLKSSMSSKDKRMYILKMLEFPIGSHEVKRDSAWKTNILFLISLLPYKIKVCLVKIIYNKYYSKNN